MIPGSLLIAGALVVASVVLAGRATRIHSHPGVIPFALLAILLGGLVALIAVVRTGLFPIEERGLVELMLIGGYAFASILWISFVFEYTGRGPAITWRRGVGLSLLGGATIASTTVTWVH